MASDAVAAAQDLFDADSILELHRGPVMRIAAPIIEAMVPDMEDFPQKTQDDMLATRVAKVLDDMLVLPEPWETLSDAVIWLVARGAIALWRSIQQFRARLGGRIDKLEDKIEARGAHWTKVRRRNANRRLRNMKRRLERRSHGT